MDVPGVEELVGNIVRYDESLGNFRTINYETLKLESEQFVYFSCIFIFIPCVSFFLTN